MTAETILNRKALRDFHILERYEAGLELKGSEVKSIRAGKANINDAFARIENGEAFLYNADIQPYERASHEIPSAKRVRKLLLHRAEIDKLYGETQVGGRALVLLNLDRKSTRLNSSHVSISYAVFCLKKKKKKKNIITIFIKNNNYSNNYYLLN